MKKLALVLLIAFSAFGVDVFYSVGQDGDDQKTGSPTMDIAAGVATFSVAQTGNIGVGDRVQYNTTSVCYISAKQSTTVWDVVTALGAAPANVSSASVDSIHREYTSLSAAVAGASDASHLNTVDLTTGPYALHFPCYYDDAADATECVVNGYTTSPTAYIQIYTPQGGTESNNNQRHAGVWDATKWHMITTTSTYDGIECRDDDMRLIGLQVMQNHSGSDRRSIVIGFGASADKLLDRCLIRGRGVVMGSGNGGIISDNSDCGVVKIRNCIIWDWLSGYSVSGLRTRGASTEWYVNNVTVGRCNYGIRATDNSVIVAKNCVVNDATGSDNDPWATGTGGSFSADCSSNVSDENDAPGDLAINGSVTFIDASSSPYNWMVRGDDAVAKDAGTDLSSDAGVAVTTDIMGTARPQFSVYDCGASEAYQKSVYYSTGQIDTDLKTGSPTMDIVDGTATLSVAQTGNIGVGDLIRYNTTSVCFISGKTSTSVWSVVDQYGANPSNITNASIDSIHHPFTSLSAAEAGATGASYLNTADLTTGPYALYFPCYYDDDSDGTKVNVNGYTTSATCFIQIYTPNDTDTEANNSQRHDGKWKADAYNLTVSTIGSGSAIIYVEDDYVKIIGIQYRANESGTYRHGIVFDAGADNEGTVSHCIGHRNLGSDAAAVTPATAADIYIYNTFYDWMGTEGVIHAQGTGTVYAYNNTFADNATGMKRTSGTFVAKNNITTGSGDANTYVGTFDAASRNNTTDSDDDIGAGSGNIKNQTITYVDADNSDYHLAGTDVGAIDKGINLYADATIAVTDDIDGDARPAAGAFCCGSDQRDATPTPDTDDDDEGVSLPLLQPLYEELKQPLYQ